MNKLKVILKKIKEFLNKLLGNEKKLLLEGMSLKDDNNFNNDYENTATEKQEFLELYKNVNDGNIPLENLMLEDLIKVLIMSQEELKIDDEKIKKLEQDIFQINDEKIILSNNK